MKKNITYKDISVYSRTTWGVTLCALVNGQLVHMMYQGYTKREMYKRFYDYCNSL